MSANYIRSKLAFVSPCCLVDFGSGAASATRDSLKMLAGEGFQCEAFCGTRMDGRNEGLIQESLAKERIKYLVKQAKIGPYAGLLIFAADGPVRLTIFENASSRGGWNGLEEAAAFLTACALFVQKNRPDVILTYGGDPVSVAVGRLAKQFAIPLVIFLHNFAYHVTTPFEAVDCVVVPSEFARQHYRRALGLDCQKAREHAQQWRPERLGPIYSDYFRRIIGT
jgi:hypothetical protein